MDIQNSFLDIHNSMDNNYHSKIILDIHIYLRISKNRFLDIHNSFLDIHKCIFGYPKIEYRISKNQMELRISIIRFMDITKYIFGYPIFNMIFGYPIMYLRISFNIADFLDIHNSIFGYP